MKSSAKGLPTRFMLVASLVLVITSVTFSSLWLVRKRLQTQALSEFSHDLLRSVDTFRASDAQRLAALRRENALLADLPSLKALMTTGDARTVIDGGVRFWTVADSDLFALADSDGHLVTVYTHGGVPSAEFRAQLTQMLGAANRHFLLADGRLFELSVQPLFFGTRETGTLLGYVINGYAVDSALVRQTTSIWADDVTFVSRDVITSTIPRPLWGELNTYFSEGLALRQTLATVSLGRQRYLMSSTDLSGVASAPLHLVVTRSFAHAEQERRELNRLLVIVGVCALGAGTVLMLAISGRITGPLEQLTRSVREYGAGARAFVPPVGGTREVRELSGAFLAMSDQVRETNQALLESERLATIGRMASSVSHDLRHYLAAVYANAEFLESSQLSDAERTELFEEIRTAVHGTTDLIDSLLIFSRSAGGAPRVPSLLSQVLERAVALVRSHPDAQGIQLHTLSCGSLETEVIMDARQMERAIYNLLLNACQAARGGTNERRVTARIEMEDAMVKVHVVDDGAGVAEVIRESLFEPFVSEGKQHGTGLGLTMANVVAREHGGSVELLRSRPGETVFVLSVARGGITENRAPAETSESTR